MLPALLCPLLLLAPLTLASPLPDTPHRPAHHRPAPPHHPAPQAYEDHGLVDGGAVLAAKDPPGYDEVFFNTRLSEAALVVGTVFFVYHAFVRPETLIDPALLGVGRAGAGGATPLASGESWGQSWVADAALQALESFDPVGRGLELVGIEGAECHGRAVCEAGRLLGADYGWLLPGHAAALEAGSDGADCELHHPSCRTPPAAALYRTLLAE